MDNSGFLLTSEIVIKLEKLDEKCLEIYTEIPKCIKQEPEFHIKSEIIDELTEDTTKSDETEMKKKHGSKTAKPKKKYPSSYKKYPWIPTKMICKICKVTLSSKQSFNYHNNAFHSNKPKPVFHCQLCPRTFPQHNFLLSHMRTHREKGVFECDICGLNNLSRLKIQRHMAMHKKIMEYQCDICPKAFKSKRYLARHVRTHIERERVKCPECDEMVYTFNMRFHIFKHKKVKPYKCDECTASFVARNKLIYHKRTHTGEKPFKCNLCGKAFTYNQTLKEHHKIFHTDFKLECIYCGKNYMSKPGLTFHLKTYHEDEQSQKESKNEQSDFKKGNKSDIKNSEGKVKKCDYSDDLKITKPSRESIRQKSNISKIKSQNLTLIKMENSPKSIKIENQKLSKFPEAQKNSQISKSRTKAIQKLPGKIERNNDKKSIKIGQTSRRK